MDQDARRKRAQFIGKSSDIRETFRFAHPEQIMKAAQVYVSDAYGIMLYDLSSQASQSYMKSWNTFVKLAWEVPRDTYTYLVENVLATNHVLFRKQIYSRYVNFFQQWILSLLVTLLETRSQKSALLEDTSRLTMMINSLCNT